MVCYASGMALRPAKEREMYGQNTCERLTCSAGIHFHSRYLYIYYPIHSLPTYQNSFNTYHRSTIEFVWVFLRVAADNSLALFFFSLHRALFTNATCLIFGKGSEMMFLRSIDFPLKLGILVQGYRLLNREFKRYCFICYGHKFSSF